jgi:hypothetical protein
MINRLSAVPAEISMLFMGFLHGFCLFRLCLFEFVFVWIVCVCVCVCVCDPAGNDDKSVPAGAPMVTVDLCFDQLIDQMDNKECLSQMKNRKSLSLKYHCDT